MAAARTLERLSTEDARILKLESPAIMGHTAKIVVVGPSPGGGALDVDALREHVAARLQGAPRARQRVAFTPLRLAPPAWVDDNRFDLAHHVRAHEAGGVVDDERLRAIIAELMSERLDHSRPLWRMDVVGPLTGERTAIVLRVHHCLADGIASMRFGSALLWDAEPDASLERTGSWRPAPVPAGLRLAAAGVRGRLAAAAHEASAAGRSAAHPARWRQAARTAARIGPALARELRPLGARGTPMDRHISSRREVAFATSELEELKRIATRVAADVGAHVTLNDVVLTVVAGGLRTWIDADGEALASLRAQVPVSMHRRYESADELGNRDSFLFVDLPLAEPDPVRRLQLINAETRERKGRHDADALYSLFHGLSHVGPLYRTVSRLASGPREFNLAISNVPGPPDPIYVLGAPVTALLTLAEPADRHALRISAISCDGRMSFGACADPEAVSGVRSLAAGIEASVAELAARC